MSVNSVNQFDPANGQPQPTNPGQLAQQNYPIHQWVNPNVQNDDADDFDLEFTVANESDTEDENQQQINNAFNVARQFLGLDVLNPFEEIGYRFDDEFSDSEDGELDAVNAQEQEPNNIFVDEQQETGDVAPDLFAVDGE